MHEALPLLQTSNFIPFFMKNFHSRILTRANRWLAALVLLLTVSSAAAAESAKSGVAPVADVKTGRFFNWNQTDVAFSDGIRGRAYATVGNLVFAIGGIGEDGRPIRDVEIVEVGKSGEFKTHHAQLSYPVAFAGAVADTAAVYIAGGKDSDGVLSQVVSIRWENGQLIENALPALPGPLLLPGVALHRSTTRYYLYVLGGSATVEQPVALDSVIELSLKDLDSGAAWQSQPPLPQGGRIAPMCTETFNEIVVMGGYATDAAHQLTPTADTWGYSRIPRDGQSESGWKKRAAFHTPFAGAAFTKSGQSHIVLIGGDTAGGSLGDLLNGTKPRSLLDGVWSFHDMTDSWAQIEKFEQPVAGGTLLMLTGESALYTDGHGADGKSVGSLILNFLRTTKQVGWLDWSMIGLYFLGVIVLGLWFARRQKTAKEFALGGGNMKWWATAISMAATGLSTISFMAIPALVASMGITASSGVIFMIPAAIFGAYVTYPLLRRLKIVSAFQYLEQRFGLILRLVGSFKAMVVQVLGRIGIVVMLPALAISSMTGIDPVYSILAIGVVTTIYSAAGGLEAVVWTDVIQGMILFAGFILIGVFSYMRIPGGFEMLADTLHRLDRDTIFITKWDLSIPMIWYAFIGAVLGAMTFAGDQSMAQRVLATPLKDVRKFAFLFGAVGVLVALLVMGVGLSLLAFFRATPELLSPVMKNDQLVPIFMIHEIPVGITGFLLATLFAAAMSTISSAVNSCSVLFAEDFYKRFNKKATQQTEMRVMRIATVVTGIFGTAAAIWLLRAPMPTLWETFMRIMALVGGGFGGVFILGMFTRRTHELGAVTGVIASIITAYVLQFTDWDIHWSGLGALITLSCVVVGYVTSLIVPWERKDLTGLTVWDQVPDIVTDEELLQGTAEAAS